MEKSIDIFRKFFFKKNKLSPPRSSNQPMWGKLLCIAFLLKLSAINALAQCNMAQPGNQALCNGAATSAINFTGATSYSWTNNNPAIGLAASGTGNIGSFTATNNTASPITATITVTPTTTGLSAAYIPTVTSNLVNVISTVTNTVSTSIGVTTYPIGVSVNPDGSRAYIANTGAGNVTVINTSTNAIVTTISGFNSPYSLAVSPDGTKLYVANQTGGDVTVVNTASNTISGSITGMNGPNAIAFTPDGTKAYVTNNFNGTVAVVNTTTNTIITTIPGFSAPVGIAMSPDGTKAYVANQNAGNVAVINTTTNTISTTIAVTGNPFGICVSPDGTLVYSANLNSNQISKINATTNTLLTSINVGTYPQGIQVSGDNSKVYVACDVSNALYVVNTSTDAVITTIATGTGPKALGNFLTPGNCTGTPVTFTITVNPNPTVSVVTSPSGAPVFYGFATSGGAGSAGVMFSFNSGNSAFASAHTFTGTPDGNQAQFEPTLASNGTFYGVTRQGGTSNLGTLFSYDPTSSVYTKLVDFTGLNGQRPEGQMIEVAGLLYGFCAEGGTNGQGVFFRYNYNTNTYTKLYDFVAGNGNETVGTPVNIGGVVYAATLGGGANGLGTIIRYNTMTNVFTKLFDFNSLGGGNPVGSVTLGADGLLYGVTQGGGANGVGTIYQYNQNTSTFTKKIDMTAAGGANAFGELALHPNNKLYGATTGGGANGVGVIFEYNPSSNTYTKLIDLTGISGAAPGNSPAGEPMVGSDGNIYGMTGAGGTNNRGVIYKYVIGTNTYSVLYNFALATGSNPQYGTLVEYGSSSTINTCSGSPVTLSGSGASSYVWTGGITNAVSFNASAGTTVYNVTGTDGNGCTGTSSAIVVGNPLPTATAGGTASICQNGSHVVSGATSANGTRLWTHNGAGTISNAGTLTPTYTAAAGDAGNTVTLTMTVSNTPCANASATYTINVTASPTVSFSGSSSTCEAQAVVISDATVTNNASHVWSIITGNGTLTNTAGLTPTYTPVAADAGTNVIIRLTVSNPPCADVFANKTISIDDRPTLNTATVNICTLTPVGTINVVSPLPLTDYKWSPAADLYMDALLTVPYVLGTSATTVYTAPFISTTYSVTATNASGCTTGATSVNVIVCPAITNDICQADLVAAIPVTTSANFIQYNLTGATSSVIASCAPIARDIWYRAIVPLEGEIDVVTMAGNNAIASLNVVSSVVSIYTATNCTTAVALANCNSNGAAGNMSFAHASNLTPGSTVYIRLASTVANNPVSAQYIRMAVTRGLVWTGAANDDFNNPANWHGGDATALTLPDANISAIVPAGNPVKPKLYANATTRGIYFLTGAPFFTSTGINLNSFNLNVKYDWCVGSTATYTNSSMVLDCNGKVIFSGTLVIAQMINGKTTFGNIEFNNPATTVQFNNPCAALCIVKATSGNVNANGNLTLRSSATQTALVDASGTGVINGNVSVERKIGSTSGYHFLSSPVSGAIINNTSTGWRDDFTILAALDGQVFIPGTIYNQIATVWEYNETNPNVNPDFGYIGATGTLDPITPLKGFACVVPGNVTVDVLGPLNNNTIPGGYFITKTAASGPGEGFNLVGNPYASPISWNAFRSLAANSATISTVGYSVFLSSGGYAGSYGTFNGTIGAPAFVTDRIASSQGIFITALQNGSINAQNSIRLNTAADLSASYFNTYSSVPDLMRFEIQGNGNANQMALYFDGLGEDGFVETQDAKQMMSPVAGMPNIYAFVENNKVAINVMGQLNLDKVVPLGVKIQTAGTYNLVATDMTSFAPSVIAYLEDTQAGTMTNLRTNPSYPVTLPVGEINNRFFIHFHPAVALNAINETCAGNDGKLEMNYPTTNTVDVIIKDENGNVVSTQNNFTGTITINNLAAGNYVVEMTFGAAPNVYTTSDYFTIAEGNAVYANLSASATTVDMNANTTVNFTATSQGSTTFNWNFGDGTVVNNGPANIAHTYAQVGTYTVTFEASNGICNTVATTTVEVTNATGLIAISNSNLQVVGLGSKVTVRFGNKMEGKGNIEVINMLGEVIAHLDNVSMKGTKEIELSNIATGQYLVKITNNNQLFTEKVFLSRQ